MDAQYIVDQIGLGVTDALNTAQFFLGIEEFEFTNADIHPEYITTVKVGERFTGPDRVVSLETSKGTLLKQALKLAHLHNWSDKVAQQSAGAELGVYKFGKKNTQRIDVVVRPSESSAPPMLLAEAKLGVRNLQGVLEDINRVVKLIAMYRRAIGPGNHYPYGAVVFHAMKEKANEDELQHFASNLLKGIVAHMSTICVSTPWIKYSSGLLTRHKVTKGVSGYTELLPDGSTEDVFAKDAFAFAPGMVLLGTANDITSVQF